MNETYQEYVNRVARLTLPTTYNVQLQNIQSSPKFERGEALSFPGYSVITPPWEEDSANEEFYSSIKELQQQLSARLEPNLLVPLPPQSFHFTLADLIWENSYRQATKENPDFDQQLKKQIKESFQQYQKNVAQLDSITWQLLGLGIRPRAILAYLVPKDEQSYEQILQLRRAIYQNSGLIGLGIEQQYDFTAHVTIGYFGEISPSLNRDTLGNTLTKLNDEFLETKARVITIKRAELRKFDNMTRYYRESDWPVVEF